MANNKNIFLIFSGLFVLAGFSFFLSLSTGSNGMSFVECLQVLLGNANENSELIIKSIRLPRVLAAIFIGAGLSASGCVFQAVLRNPLAEPLTLGVSGGAVFGAAAAVVLAVSTFFIPLFSFAGAFLAVGAVYALSRKKSFDSNAMILSGVAVSYVFSSTVMLIYSMSSAHQIQAAFSWLMGDLSTVDTGLLIISAVIICAGIAVLSMFGNIINVISLGEQKAQTLGINAQKYVKLIFITASLVAAVSVALCGVIGFVGLMIPHIMRKILGGNNIILIPASALGGAIFLPLCNAVSRTLFAPVILPAKIITGIASGIFFMFLLSRAK
ncbi:MAG: iron ABC transporter permease [Endomicrobia bacterium]|nr:iron ABC transporter permease [Endomicrobiia bacterium]